MTVEKWSARRPSNTEGEIGRVRVVEDFPPRPDDLAPREDNVKVTVSPSRHGVEYFKHPAKKRRVPYQRIIRALVDAYAEKQKENELCRIGWAERNESHCARPTNNPSPGLHGTDGAVKDWQGGRGADPAPKRPVHA